MPPNKQCPITIINPGRFELYNIYKYETTLIRSVSNIWYTGITAFSCDNRIWRKPCEMCLLLSISEISLWYNKRFYEFIVELPIALVISHSQSIVWSLCLKFYSSFQHVFRERQNPMYNWMRSDAVLHYSCVNPCRL